MGRSDVRPTTVDYPGRPVIVAIKNRFKERKMSKRDRPALQFTVEFFESLVDGFLSSVPKIGETITLPCDKFGLVKIENGNIVDNKTKWKIIGRIREKNILIAKVL